MTYASEVLADSPLLYWRLGEASGTTAADASGNGRTGTYMNGPTLGVAGLQSSDSDTAASFDGVNDYVTGSAPAHTSGFTITALHQLTSTSNGPIATRYGAAGNRLFILQVSGGKISANVQNAGGSSNSFAGTTILATGVPYHFALTYDGSGSLLYLNGVLEATNNAVTGSMANVTPALEVAARTFTPAYRAGIFDEVALYNYALSGARIAAHAAAASPPAPITIHPAKITSTSAVRAPAIVPYVAPVDGNINITAELAPARWSAAVTQPDRSAEIQPARHTAGVQS